MGQKVWGKDIKKGSAKGSPVQSECLGEMNMVL